MRNQLVPEIGQVYTALKNILKLWFMIERILDAGSEVSMQK
jgi:hypothetical protein